MTTTRRISGRGEGARLLASIANLVSEAGAQILRIKAQTDAPRMKADMSPVTAADEAAEALICEGLARILPGVPVIGEEAVAERHPSPPAGTYMLVDPIDGTREMIAGRDEYTVNVALIEDHAPVLGVVYAPSLAALYAGADGRACRAATKPGAHFEPDAATPIRARARPERLVALVSRSHPDPASENFLASLPVEKKIPLGSSLKLTRVAEGAADVYARLATTNEWDIGAGHAVLAAAGGAVTAPDGSVLAYGKNETGFQVNGFVAWGGPPAA